MAKKHLFIANWKNYLTHVQAVCFVAKNKIELKEMAKQQSLVICPPATAITSFSQVLINTNVHVGGQDCAPIIKGAATGAISAESLKQAGCSYCIVGHSEQRYQFFTPKTAPELEERVAINQLVVQKFLAAVSQKLIPIICVGENLWQKKQGLTNTIISEQLEPICAAIAQQKLLSPLCIIAYEPIWAIGSGITPSNEEIASTIQHIQTIILEANLAKDAFSFVYGGSVSSDNINTLKQICEIDGFLIGKSSTDFQELEKIVS
jgi:triosephosphate isomerase